MRTIAVLLIALSAAAVPASYERLAAAGRAWAWVHYTHPWLAGYSAVDWDAAFVEAAPKILQAQTDAEYVSAVRAMVAKLDDPATYVREGAPRMPPPREASWNKTEDGVIVFDPGHGFDRTGIQKFVPQLTAELAKADVKGMIVDARQSPSFYFRWSDSLSPQAAPGVSMLSRRWSGYPPPEANFGSGGYSTSVELAPGAPARVTGSGIKKPLVFVVSSMTNTPLPVLALYSAGHAAIVCEGGQCENAAIPQQEIELEKGLSLIVRTHELVHADGTSGFMPNRQVDAGGIEAALEIVRSGAFESPKRAAFRVAPKSFAEKPYSEQTYPPLGVRLLGAVRAWSVFAHFFPYKNLIGEDWDKALPGALADVERAANALEYHQAVARLVARTNDSHSGCYSAVLNDHFGVAVLPFSLRWIEKRPVVTNVAADGTLAGVTRGDVLLSVDGRSVDSIMETHEPYIAASTQQSKRSRMLTAVLRGADESRAKLVFEGAGGARKELSVRRSRTYYPELMSDRTGPVFHKNEHGIGYVDLQRLDGKDVNAMFDALEDSKGIVMDMRGYPRGTAWAIAPRLSSADQPVNAQFRRNAIANGRPETMYFEQKIPLRSGELYTGRTVMLIDERAISQSEHSGLMYRTANRTKFIGSPTTGANGDVTFFMVPGGIRVTFTGHDVRWPDGRQLQRVGLQPDIPVEPTIRGIREGRDEVLAKALEYLTSSEAGKP